MHPASQTTAARHQGLILSQEQIATGVYLLTLTLPAVAQAARPGQFLHLRCGRQTEWLLRRPLSIHTVDRQQGIVTMLYQVVGQGTAWLAAQAAGTALDILGPLGRPFTMPPPGCRRAVIVAGGIGIAPLYFLARELAGSGVPAEALLGARTSAALLRLDALERLGLPVQVATDDGSAGRQGLVTALLDQSLAADPAAFAYACGPEPMLRAIAALLKQHGVPGEVSLEERMACGLGACRGCAVPLRAAGGGVAYANSCSDGPVFRAEEVAW